MEDVTQRGSQMELVYFYYRKWAEFEVFFTEDHAGIMNYSWSLPKKSSSCQL